MIINIKTYCHQFIENLSLEIDRFSLWIPVFIGLGILAYFSLPFEPSYSHAIIYLIPIIPLAFFYKKSHLAEFALKILLLMMLGFVASKYRTDSVHTNFISHEYKGVTEGVVEKVEYLEHTARLTLKDVRFTFRRAPLPPKKVRIRLLNGEKNIPKTGDKIQIFGQLAPPPSPAMPGGFDFQRFMYFKSIGAVGFAMGHPKLIKTNTGGGINTYFAHIREKLIFHLREVMPDEEGRIAIALITGDKNPIKKKTLEEIRASGLAHLLAISGLHISLVAGLFYGMFRFLLACSPYLALHYPIKKWAASIGFVAALFYMFLVDCPIPTQRAIMMLGLVVLAVLTDREALTMRLVCLAATVVLLLLPESLMSPSFQMSFAAVAALVAFYEKYNDKIFALYEKSFLNKILLHIIGLFITSLISTLATSAFSLYHFNTVSLYGIIANLIAVPLTAFWIMPFGILGCFLMLFGISKYAFIMMGFGIKGILITAHYVASIPYSLLVIKQMSDFSFGLILFGGLWLLLWGQKWRFKGVWLIAVGLALIPFQTRPDVLIADKGKLIGALSQDKTLYLTHTRKEKFVADIWLKALGARQKKLFPEGEDVVLKGGYKMRFVDEQLLILNQEEQVERVDLSKPIKGSHDFRLHKKNIQAFHDTAMRGHRPWVR